MMSFSLNELRKITAGETGYRLDLAAAYDEAKPVGGLASSAHAFLNTVVACVLTDLHEPARQLLRKSQQWLEDAIASDERPEMYFPHATEAQRLYDLATCRWLSNGSRSPELLRAAMTERERWFDSQRKIDRVSFVMTVHQYVDAAAHAELSQRIAKLWPKAKRPLEIEVAAQLFTANPDRRATEKLFAQRMSEWLGSGRYLDAACWLKAGFGVGDSLRPPFEIVREARKYVL